CVRYYAPAVARSYGGNVAAAWGWGMIKRKTAGKARKGIILAGGAGTRRHPLTSVVSKQLLPVYDTPKVYYPVPVRRQARIQEILVTTTPEDQAQFKRLLGDGSRFGVSLSYVAQPKPEGLAQAFILGEEFLDGHPSAMILGDNI